MFKEDYMLSEIFEQKELASFHSSEERSKFYSDLLEDRIFNNIIFTGCGDSYCASLFASTLMNEWDDENQIPAFSFYPFDLNNFIPLKLLKESLVIGISVSGNTPRVVESLKFAQEHGAYTLGLTDNPNGKIVKIANQSVFIYASPSEELLKTNYKSPEASEYVGYHHDCAQTKTYYANLLVLSQLVSSVLEKQNKFKGISSLVKTTLDSLFSLNNYVEDFKGVKNIIFVGSGINHPTALFGKYKMYEFTLNGHHNDIEDYAHTQYFITNENSLVIFIAGDNASMIRIEEIEPVIRERIGAKTLIIGSNKLNTKLKVHTFPTLSDTILSPLTLTIPIEYVSYYIAKVKGFDTNTFRGGVETEKYVSGSQKTIRQSKISFTSQH